MKSIGHLLLAALLIMAASSATAQRLRPRMGRGVVVSKADGDALVSWRRLAQEPEGQTYNIYVKTSGGEYTLLNESPISGTCYATTSTAVPSGSSVAVSAISPEGVEGDLSDAWTVESFSWNNVALDIAFETTVLTPDDYHVKYIWPADLDGDGEMEFVCDRLSTTDISTRSHKLQAYDREGNCLWTVDMGPNIDIDAGQNDMVTVADVDCDGKAEVIIRSSDGTRFWDADAGDYGTYVFGGDDPDVDGDGVTDYWTQYTRTPPFYASVIDGTTGAEKASAWLNYDGVSDGSDTWTRTNLSDYYNQSYGFMEGHFCAAYLDGVHPSIVMECQTRTTDGNHHTYVFTFQYDFTSTDAVGTNWHHENTWVLGKQSQVGATFHQLRVADVDGDGLDEMVQGGYSVNPLSGTYVYPSVGHGDRFRLSDINPARPGLETYVIQQSALLGQALYDAATGEHLKEWYLSAVGDVGRGECMDVDSTHLGYEVYSTMDGLYDCEGDLIASGETSYPYEGIWWDGDLGREVLSSHGGSGWKTNAMISEYDGTRLIQMSKESDYAVRSCTANRPLFFGDILGDWREEVILAKQSDDWSTGFVVYATHYDTDYSFYCLQEDPHYTGDCTTRGYYQSPNTGFYLGYDMPLPPLPPTMQADVRYSSGSWTSSLADGQTILFDLTGENSAAISIESLVQPDTTFFITPLGHDYTFSGSGTIGGTGDIWKSGQGSVVLPAGIATTGTTYISEGILNVSGSISGPVDLRARGTLMGDVTLCDTLILEGALNYEGCRLMPGTAEGTIGSIAIDQGLNITAPLYMEMDISSEGSDLITVNGDLTVSATAYFTINSLNDTVQPGMYELLRYTGTLNGSTDDFSVRGLTGLSYNIVDSLGSIYLRVNAQRDASEGVVWSGTESSDWDYQTANFLLDDVATEFVAQDAVLFNDDATTGKVTIDELMPTTGVTIDNSSLAYTFSGDGGLSGEGGLTKEGSGSLTINLTKSDYTGATIINGGTVTVSELANAGTASAFGSGSTSASNWQIGNAKLIVDNSSANTDRGLTLTDTATIQNASGTLTLQGIVSGSGTLVKAGAGQLSFTYAGNTWKGGTILNAGTLAMGAWNTTFGSSTSQITANGGTIVVFDVNSTSTVPVFSNVLYIPSGKKVTLSGGKRCKVQGTLTGEGTLYISFPYVRGDFSTDCSAFAGTIEVTSGTFRLTANMDLSGGTFVLDDAVYAASYTSQSGTETSRTHKIGALSSTATDATLSTGTWNVGYLGTDTEFAGIINSSATFNKYGDGTLTLSGQSAAAINVRAGTLSVTNETCTTTGKITVYSGAMLCGDGAASSVLVKSGATLAAGKPTAMVARTLTLDGDLTVASGATIRLKARSTRNIDEFDVSGAISLTDPSFVIERLSGDWSTDVDYQVFSAGDGITISGDITFSPETPLDGYLWDTSALATDGILRVVADPVAVNAITADEALQHTVYDLAGHRLNAITAQGIYIVDGQKRFVRTTGDR